ncbi:hypothetical protein BAE44_0021567, partial [Dichanthelium oligosanthes]
LISQAWKAWEAGRIEEEFDPSRFDGPQLTEIKRCVQVGLLCAQSDRADRPTMAEVLQMLHGERELPIPKKPSWASSCLLYTSRFCRVVPTWLVFPLPDN